MDDSNLIPGLIDISSDLNENINELILDLSKYIKTAKLTINGILVFDSKKINNRKAQFFGGDIFGNQNKKITITGNEDIVFNEFGIIDSNLGSFRCSNVSTTVRQNLNVADTVYIDVNNNELLDTVGLVVDGGLISNVSNLQNIIFKSNLNIGGNIYVYGVLYNYANTFVSNSISVNGNLTISNKLYGNIIFVEQLYSNNIYTQTINNVNKSIVETINSNNIITDSFVSNTFFNDTLISNNVIANDIIDINNIYANTFLTKNLEAIKLVSNNNANKINIFNYNYNTNNIISNVDNINNVFANNMVTSNIYVANIYITNSLNVPNLRANALTAINSFNYNDMTILDGLTVYYLEINGDHIYNNIDGVTIGDRNIKINYTNKNVDSGIVFSYENNYTGYIFRRDNVDGIKENSIFFANLNYNDIVTGNQYIGINNLLPLYVGGIEGNIQTGLYITSGNVHVGSNSEIAFDYLNANNVYANTFTANIITINNDLTTKFISSNNYYNFNVIQSNGGNVYVTGFDQGNSTIYTQNMNVTYTSNINNLAVTNITTNINGNANIVLSYIPSVSISKGQYIYNVTNNFPGKVYKIDTNTFSVSSMLTLNPGEILPPSAIIYGNYIFIGTFSLFAFTTKIVKIDLTTFTRIGAITLGPGEDDLYSAIVYNNYGFFGTGTNKIVKVDLNAFTRIGSITLDMYQFQTAVVKDKYGYFGTYDGYIVKIDLDSFAFIESIYIGFSLYASLVYKNYAYFSFGSTITKIDLNTFTIVNNLTIGASDIKSATIWENYGLFSSLSQAKIYKIDFKSFTLVETIISGESSIITSITVDNYGYFSTNDSPTYMKRILLGSPAYDINANISGGNNIIVNDININGDGNNSNIYGNIVTGGFTVNYGNVIIQNYNNNFEYITSNKTLSKEINYITQNNIYCNIGNINYETINGTNYYFNNVRTLCYNNILEGNAYISFPRGKINLNNYDNYRKLYYDGDNWNDYDNKSFYIDTCYTVLENSTSSYQGYSIKLNSNGKYLYASTPYDGNGNIWLFERNLSINGVNNMGWSEQIRLNVEFNPLYHPINSNIISLGNEIDCSADGNILVSGAISSLVNGIYRGAVGVFVNNGSWNSNIIYQEVGTYFGCSVSINADGSKILIGRFGDNSETGNAFIYNIPNNGWINGPYTYQTILGSGIGVGSFFGHRVKMGQNICCIGGLEKVWLFKFDGINWKEFQILTNPGSYTNFGMYGMDISNNNEYLVIGAPISIGCVYVYKLIKQQYILIQTLSSNNYEGSSPLQGISVTISSDGRTIVYGGVTNGITNDKGGIWIWRKYGGKWYEQVSQSIFSANISITPGQSVSLTKDGSILAVGAPAVSYSNKGAIGIYY